MSAGSRPGKGRSVDVHVGPDGTVHVIARVGGGQVDFKVTRQQQKKLLEQLRPAAPYLATVAAGVVAVGLVAAASA